MLPENDTKKNILIECGNPKGVIGLPIGSNGMPKKENGAETTEDVTQNTIGSIERNIRNV